MHVAHRRHAARGVAVGEARAVVARLQGNAGQAAVEAEGPGVIGAAEEAADIAAGLAGEPRALVRAAVVQDLYAVRGVAHHDDGLRADRGGVVVAELGHLAVVADIDPGVGEEMLHLQLEQLLVEIEVAMDLGLAHQGGDGLSIASVFADHRKLSMVLMVSSSARPSASASAACAQAAHPLRRIGAAVELLGHRHQARELAFARVVGVRVAFDQPARFEDLDRKRDVAPRHRASALEPGLDMRLLAAMAQRAAAEAAQAGQQIKRQEPADRAGAHPPAAIDQAAQDAEHARARLDPEPEPGRQGAADLLHARMHELGRVDELVGLGGHFGAHPGEAAVARLEVGDADHVVIGHGARDLLGRGRA